MANQPKKYKKFVATAATATLVASAIVPVASAAGFSDISKLDQQTQDAINALSDAGVIKGYADGTFKPNQTLTRGQVAKLLGRWLEAKGTPAPADYQTVQAFDDVPLTGDAELVKYAALVKAAGVFTGSNNKLNPGGNITRQQISKVLNNAYGKVNGKTLVDLAESVNDANVQDLAKAQAEFQPYIQALADLGVTTVANFNPTGNVTRGQFAKFLNITANVSGTGTTAPVNPGTVNPIDPIPGDITVVALDDTNRYLQITFDQSVKKLDAANIRIQNIDTLELYGAKSVQLSADGKIATVELFSPDNTLEVLEYNQEYSVKVNVGDKTLEDTFIRAAFDEQRVVDVDVDDRKITLVDEKPDSNGKLADLGTLKILSDVEIDFEEAKGRTIKVWYNNDREIIKYAYETKETVVYSPVQLDKSFAGNKNEGRIVTLTDGKKLELSDTKFSFSINDNVVRGKSVEFDKYREANIKNEKDPELDWAKVVIGKNGEVEYIAGYNFEAYAVVKNVDVAGKEIVGEVGTSSIGKADKYLVIKDNKVIAYKDLQPGDVVLYNQKAYNGDGIAVVVNNTVKGTIETVNKTSIQVAGKEYTFDRNLVTNPEAIYYAGNMPTAKFVDEDGDYVTAKYDDFEDLQRGGEVTLYLDAKGDLLFAKGQQVEGAKNVAVLTDNATTDTAFGKDSVQLEVFSADKTEKIYKVQLDTLRKITLNGVEYDIDTKANLSVGEYSPTLDAAKTNIVLTPFGGGANVTIPLADLTKGKLVEFGFNKSGVLDELKVFNGTAGKEDISTINSNANKNQLLEAGDAYAVTKDGAKKLSDRVVVFDVTKGSGVSYDAKDITVTSWKDYNGSDISQANVLYDDKGEVVAIVITEKVSTDVVYEEAVITKVTRNVDGELTAISAYVNGKVVDLSADKLDNANAKALTKGDVALLTFDKGNTTLVKDVTRDGRVEAKGLAVVNVNTGEREVTFSNGITYKLAADGAVLDGRNNDGIVVESFSFLTGKNNVTVVLDEVNGTFAKYFVVEPNKTVVVETGATVTAKITTLPATITLTDKAAVQAARTAYTALSATEQALVTNYATLVAAEAKIAQLEAASAPTVTGLSFTDTDTDANEIAGEIKFTATNNAATVVTVNGNAITPVNGVYTVASNTAIGTGAIKVVVTNTAGVTAEQTINAVDVKTATSTGKVFSTLTGAKVVSNGLGELVVSVPKTSVTGDAPYTITVKGKAYTFAPNILDANVLTVTIPTADATQAEVEAGVVDSKPAVQFSTVTGAKVTSNSLGEFIVSAPKASFGTGTTFSITVKGTKYDFAPNILDASILTVSIPEAGLTAADINAGTVVAN